MSSSIADSWIPTSASAFNRLQYFSSVKVYEDPTSYKCIVGKEKNIQTGYPCEESIFLWIFFLILNSSLRGVLHWGSEATPVSFVLLHENVPADLALRVGLSSVRFFVTSCIGLCGKCWFTRLYRSYNCWQIFEKSHLQISPPISSENLLRSAVNLTEMGI